jgi:hypothetical protein
MLRGRFERHGRGDVNQKGIIYAVLLPYEVTAGLEVQYKPLMLLALPTGIEPVFQP